MVLQYSLIHIADEYANVRQAPRSQVALRARAAHPSVDDWDVRLQTLRGMHLAIDEFPNAAARIIGNELRAGDRRRGSYPKPARKDRTTGYPVRSGKARGGFYSEGHEILNDVPYAGWLENTYPKWRGAVLKYSLSRLTTLAEEWAKWYVQEYNKQRRERQRQLAKELAALTAKGIFHGAADIGLGLALGAATGLPEGIAGLGRIGFQAGQVAGIGLSVARGRGRSAQVGRISQRQSARIGTHREQKLGLRNVPAKGQYTSSFTRPHATVGFRAVRKNVPIGEARPLPGLIENPAAFGAERKAASRGAYLVGREKAKGANRKRYLQPRAPEEQSRGLFDGKVHRAGNTSVGPAKGKSFFEKTRGKDSKKRRR